MARGALRSRRASVKAIGTAMSPSARRGGVSSAMSAIAGSSGGQAVEAADGLGDAGADEVMDGQNHSKLFRDTIFGRFLIQFNPAPGAFVIMRRVDVLEQRPVVVRRQRVRSEHADPDVLEQPGDLQRRRVRCAPARPPRSASV